MMLIGEDEFFGFGDERRRATSLGFWYNPILVNPNHGGVLTQDEQMRDFLLAYDAHEVICDNCGEKKFDFTNGGTTVLMRPYERGLLKACYCKDAKC